MPFNSIQLGCSVSIRNTKKKKEEDKEKREQMMAAEETHSFFFKPFLFAIMTTERRLLDKCTTREHL